MDPHMTHADINLPSNISSQHFLNIYIYEFFEITSQRNNSTQIR